MDCPQLGSDVGAKGEFRLLDNRQDTSGLVRATFSVGMADPAFPSLPHAQKVALAIWVPLRAMRLAHIPACPAIAPKIVLPSGYGLQVIRIHAPPIATEVIDLHTAWNRTDKVLVGPPVDVDVAPPVVLRVRHVCVPACG